MTKLLRNEPTDDSEVTHIDFLLSPNSIAYAGRSGCLWMPH